MKRELIVTHLESGLAVTGRCSRCHRPFEAKSDRSPAVANHEILAAFEQHACKEDANQAAFRIVQHVIEKTESRPEAKLADKTDR